MTIFKSHNPIPTTSNNFQFNILKHRNIPPIIIKPTKFNLIFIIGNKLISPSPNRMRKIFISIRKNKNQSQFRKKQRIIPISLNINNKIIFCINRINSRKQISKIRFITINSKIKTINNILSSHNLPIMKLNTRPQPKFPQIIIQKPPRNSKPSLNIQILISFNQSLIHINNILPINRIKRQRTKTIRS